jgi:hypothetical protein
MNWVVGMARTEHHQVFLTVNFWFILFPSYYKNYLSANNPSFGQIPETVTALSLINRMDYIKPNLAKHWVVFVETSF